MSGRWGRCQGYRRARWKSSSVRLRVGPVTNHARVITEEGLTDEKFVTTQIAAPQIKVVKTAPPTGLVGAPITYQIAVSNPGAAPATNVVLKDQFDPGLEHVSKPKDPFIDLRVGTLQPGETKTVPLVLTPRGPGTFVNRVDAVADGGLSDHSECVVQVADAKLAVKKTGPTWCYKTRPADWNIQVSNPGDVPLTGVVVRDVLPPQLTFTSASDGGQLENGQVVWNIGTLQPRQEKAVQVLTSCAELAPQVINVATATADGGLQDRAEAPLEIRGIAAYRLEVIDTKDPVEVGGNTTYKITVTNTGSLAGNRVEIVAQVPAEMKVVNVQGPSSSHANGQTIMFDPMDSLAKRLF